MPTFELLSIDLSDVIAVVALIVSIIAFWRTGRFQEADQRPTVELTHGVLKSSSVGTSFEFKNDAETAIVYSGRVRNVGERKVTVVIASIYARGFDSAERAIVDAKRLDQSMRPGESIEVKFLVTAGKLKEMTKRCSSDLLRLSTKVRCVGGADIKGVVESDFVLACYVQGSWTIVEPWELPAAMQAVVDRAIAAATRNTADA